MSGGAGERGAAGAREARKSHPRCNGPRRLARPPLVFCLRSASPDRVSRSPSIPSISMSGPSSGPLPALPSFPQVDCPCLVRRCLNSGSAVQVSRRGFCSHPHDPWLMERRASRVGSVGVASQLALFNASAAALLALPALAAAEYLGSTRRGSAMLRHATYLARAAQPMRALDVIPRLAAN